MSNSHLWFSMLPYSAFYRFLQKSGICAKNEKIVGVKDVVRYDVPKTYTKKPGAIVWVNVETF